MAPSKQCRVMPPSSKSHGDFMSRVVKASFAFMIKQKLRFGRKKTIETTEENRKRTPGVFSAT